MRIVILALYFPPINSSGAKRFEALSRYFAQMGHDVTVVTPTKTASDGNFTETPPVGVRLLEIDSFGQVSPSKPGGVRNGERRYSARPTLSRRFKDFVFRWCGQVVDPRLIFSINILSPWLATEVRDTLRRSQVVIGTCPPYPILLAAIFARMRFGTSCVLDYRDHFSECHEMPGSAIAKAVEKKIDRFLVRKAHRVVVVSPPMKTYYDSLGDTPVAVVMNGFDNEVFDKVRQQARYMPSPDGKITIRYLGMVSPGRVPHALFRALMELVMTDPSRAAMIRIEFYGLADPIKEILKERYWELSGNVSFHAYLPYAEALRTMIEADYLLVSEDSKEKTLSAQGILTTKLFEYIGSGRPIIGHIARESLIGKTILSRKGFSFVSDNEAEILDFLRGDQFVVRRDTLPADESFEFSRRYQAEQYIRVIEGVVAGRNSS